MPVINNLQVTEYIKQAFALTKQLEAMPNNSRKRAVQLTSLIAIADHEQRKILQPLIYESYAFQLTLDAQALAEGLPLVPLRAAAFSTACDIENTELRVQMTDSDLYKETDRMKFIERIANKYHVLMGNRSLNMEDAIATIATCRNAT